MAKTNKGTKVQVLCIDGQAAGNNTLTWILEGYDYAVTTAHSAQDALRLAQAQHFDLYILDSWMPDGAEYDLCREIRKFDGHTPLIFYSSKDENAGSENARAAGGQIHIRKPVYPKRLMQLIADVLRTSPKAEQWVI